MTAPLDRLRTLLDIATRSTTNIDEARNAALAACRIIVEEKLLESVGGGRGARVRRGGASNAWASDRVWSTANVNCTCSHALSALGIHSTSCPVGRRARGLDDDVLFVAVQGPLVGGGRDVHLVRELPNGWPRELADGVCGVKLRPTRGSSFTQVTRKGAPSFKNDLFMLWPTSLLCARCALFLHEF